MKAVFALLAAGLSAACTEAPAPLVVKTFQLRDEQRDPEADPMARMEKQRRLLGAVSLRERRQRLGQYYTVVWHDDSAVKSPAELVFEYRQGGSGSRVKRMTRTFQPFATEGRAEFAVIGDDYFDNGRVLAWQATLRRDGREVASQRSYLWQ